MTISAPKHYVGVTDPRLIYVILEDREEFDKIGLEATRADHPARTFKTGITIPAASVLFKAVEQHGVRVVFQHWLRSQPS